MNDNDDESRSNESDDPDDSLGSGWLVEDVGLLVAAAVLWAVVGLAIAGLIFVIIRFV